jgi:low affinity Fe/Cu permease
MLEVTVIIGGAVVAFIAMVLWANSGRFKSENDTDLV